MASNPEASAYIQAIERRDKAAFVKDAYPQFTEKTILEYLQRSDWDVEQATVALSKRQSGPEVQQAESSKVQEKLQQQQHSSSAAPGSSKLASRPATTTGSGSSAPHHAISIAIDSNDDQPGIDPSENDDPASDLYGVSDEERNRQKSEKRGKSGKRAASSEGQLQSSRKKSKGLEESEGSKGERDGEGSRSGKEKEKEEQKDEEKGDEQEDEKEEDDSASDWVENAAGQFKLKTGIVLALDSGDHPVVFTRKLLRDHFDFFEERLQPNPPGAKILLETIEVPFVSRVMFDIIFQWATSTCRQGLIVLTEARLRTPTIEIDNLIQLALAAKLLGPPSSDLLETTIADRIRSILREDRNRLSDYHIERACGGFKREHAVRRVIIDTLVEPYAKCRGDIRVAATRKPYVDASSEQKCYAQIIDTPGLEAELNELVMVAIRGRQKWDTTRTAPTELQDPLFKDGVRGGQFVINVDPHTSKTT
ncbi:uncharacterized protein PAC_00505 [Phialocephala subalpina]|uniref:CUE domain-containing protein n=1 Tax=Phialocephala subalpina TaxID=576137 RepID=A0A1L7WCX6_9HELO|nr:uncharacterized protein PAC_00505 [Phialocephala subalpina]